MAQARRTFNSLGARQAQIESMARRGLLPSAIARELNVGLSYVENVVRVLRHELRKPEGPLGPGIEERCDKHARACLAQGGFEAREVDESGKTIRIMPDARSLLLNPSLVAAE
jgi:hypothetical protein